MQEIVNTQVDIIAENIIKNIKCPTFQIQIFTKEIYNAFNNHINNAIWIYKNFLFFNDDNNIIKYSGENINIIYNNFVNDIELTLSKILKDILLVDIQNHLKNINILTSQHIFVSEINPLNGVPDDNISIINCVDISYNDQYCFVPIPLENHITQSLIKVLNSDNVGLTINSEIFNQIIDI